MECDVLNNFNVKVEDTMEYTSDGPVHAVDVPNDHSSSSKTHIIETVTKDEDITEEDDEPKFKRGRKDTVKKQDPQMLLDGMCFGNNFI